MKLKRKSDKGPGGDRDGIGWLLRKEVVKGDKRDEDDRNIPNLLVLYASWFDCGSILSRIVASENVRAMYSQRASHARVRRTFSFSCIFFLCRVRDYLFTIFPR